jgi:predicted P-loop ATPase
MQTLKIAYGDSRLSKRWVNKTITFDELCERFKTPRRTTETVAEYKKFTKDKRDGAKDVGGYVLGHLKSGRRKKDTVESRSGITLDADHADKEFISRLEMLCPYKCAVYSTHSHTPDEPRLRVVIPISREVSPDEYAALSRLVAAEIGMDYFDDSTYEPERLMYWPSAPADGEYIFKAIDGDILEPDQYLARLSDWRDCSLWPTSSRQSEVIARSVTQQQDPLAKDGVVGAFCRAYPIEDAMAAFLPGIYEPSAMSGRYDYIPADSSAGVVLYEGKWVYSHHATDPACGKLLNAFDLVRIHKFGEMDDKKSFNAMCDFAVKDDAVKTQLAEERKTQAATDFEEDGNWESALALEKNGKVKDSLDNLVLIIDNDPNLACIAYNELKSNIDFTAIPAWKPIKYPTWTDNDTSQLRCYISDVYGIYSPNKTQDALNKAAAKRKHHPIREFLNSLPSWDGTKRVETLLIDYLGAEDNDYIRAVTRKTIVAAVARVFVPGIKFDSVLVMDGPQEKGKSTLFNKLAGDEWFNDGLTLTDMQDKSGAEKLQGYWILEIGELTGMRKSDIDSVKSFISRRDDKYRASYGRVVESHPRQSIIVATVNSMGGFLRDPTGNRRFWPVVTPGGTTKHSWDITDEEVRQVWAEAVQLWKNGEKLYLEGSVKEIAAKEQNAALETDPREGMVREYLDKLLPENWCDYDLGARRTFLYGSDFGTPHEGSVQRETVSTVEIWCECFGKDQSNMKRPDGYELGVVLRKLGWLQTDRREYLPIYGRQRVWERDKG